MKSPAVLLALFAGRFGFPHVIAHDLREGFRRRGIETIDFRGGLSSDVVEDLYRRFDIRFSFSMNFPGSKFGTALRGPVLTWQQDQPFLVGPRGRSDDPHQHWLCADGDIVDHAGLFFGRPASCTHLPHWGTAFDWRIPAPPGDNIPFALRPFDVLFVGTINEAWVDDKRREAAALPAPFACFAERLFAHMVERHDVSLTGAALDLLDGADPQRDRAAFELFCKATTLVGDAVRTHRRIDLLKALDRSGVRVNVCSTNFDAASKYLRSFQRSGPGDFVSGLYVMRFAKLVMNPLPLYSDGATERLFNAQLRGAAVLSETNRFLRRTYREGEEILLYDPVIERETLSERIAESVARPDLADIAAAGRARAEADHTVDARLDTLLERFPVA